MKEFFKKFFKLLWNKTFLAFIVGAILTALGIKYDVSVVNSIVCALPGVTNCVQEANVK